MTDSAEELFAMLMVLRKKGTTTPEQWREIERWLTLPADSNEKAPPSLFGYLEESA